MSKTLKKITLNKYNGVLNVSANDIKELKKDGWDGKELVNVELSVDKGIKKGGEG